MMNCYLRDELLEKLGFIASSNWDSDYHRTLWRHPNKDIPEFFENNGYHKSHDLTFEHPEQITRFLKFHKKHLKIKG